MSLLLHIIVTYVKENIITKLQKLYSLPRNPRADNNLPMLFVKKPLCMGNLLPVCKIFIERPEVCNIFTISQKEVRNGIHFLQVEKHQSFYKLALSFLMKVPRHVQST